LPADSPASTENRPRFQAQRRRLGYGVRREPVLFVALAFAGLGVVSLVRGLTDAGPWAFHWFDGYADALNSVRVSKSLICASAFWPLLKAEFQCSPPRALGRLALGMQLGLTFVGLALLLERAAYPGILEFSARYRTTATFWEMHVGGAALDAYLALATPFAAWALWSARSPRGWAAAALLALLTAHAGLTTFSRGAYVGIALPLAMLGGAWWLRRLRTEPRTAGLTAAWSISLALGATALLTAAFVVMGYAGTGLALLSLSIAILAIAWHARTSHWRRPAAMALTLALITEAVAVIGGGSFMRSRLDASQSDLSGRLAHWRHGIELLQSPADWLLGIGAGRLPSRYAAQVPGGEFSGALTLAVTESEAPSRAAVGSEERRRSRRTVRADPAGPLAFQWRVPGEPAGPRRATGRHCRRRVRAAPPLRSPVSGNDLPPDAGRG
jgi:hypothetical protein